MLTMSYQEVKDGLVTHFKGETIGQVCRLQGLKQGTTTLYEHNVKFSC